MPTFYDFVLLKSSEVLKNAFIASSKAVKRELTDTEVLELLRELPRNLRRAGLSNKKLFIICDECLSLYFSIIKEFYLYV